MPVVRSNWVADCEKTSQRLPFSKYMLAPLAGCLLSFTNLQKKVRQRLKGAIESLGGRMAPDMSKSCTHLVVGDLHPISQKLRCASVLQPVSTAETSVSASSRRSPWQRNISKYSRHSACPRSGPIMLPPNVMC